uniref:Uncharacterized protein n=1 Tax=Rhizophora mucronata TaxID=61149 RepID=A0A2P2M4V5_RHIMU
MNFSSKTSYPSLMIAHQTLAPKARIFTTLSWTVCPVQLVVLRLILCCSLLTGVAAMFTAGAPLLRMFWGLRIQVLSLDGGLVFTLLEVTARMGVIVGLFTVGLEIRMVQIWWVHLARLR